MLEVSAARVFDLARCAAVGQGCPKYRVSKPEQGPRTQKLSRAHTTRGM